MIRKALVIAGSASLLFIGSASASSPIVSNANHDITITINGETDLLCNLGSGPYIKHVGVTDLPSGKGCDWVREQGRKPRKGHSVGGWVSLGTI